MLDLLVEKGYQAVTVQDIIDRADVVRSTFYAHFADKQDLLRSGLDELRAGLRPAPPEPGQPARLFGFSLHLFRHCRRHQRLFPALMSPRAGAPVQRWLAEMIADLVREDLAAAHHPPAPTRVPPEVTVQFLTGAYLSLLTWWLSGDRPETPEQMDQMFRRLAVPATRAALRPPPSAT
jgi:AcrR family transcriptional regulator